ncbi:MAG: c-type cytochrome [Gemmatimonadota bacterium]|nr:c-type cytochrome [Gemmatimonadota bacterium]
MGTPHFQQRAGQVISLCSIAVVMMACGNGDQRTEDTAAGEAATPAPAGTTATDPGQITAQMVALGDSIFEGQAAGGICYTCHGPEGKGTQLGPDLTDQQWLNGDGSYDFIVQTVTNGVLTPKQFSAPMPPFGQTLSPEQIRAVSAYVYSFTHPVTGG